MHIVTGGAGFIGSAFVAELNNRGINDILIVDELGSSEKWKNLVNLNFTDYINKDDFYELVDSGCFDDAKSVVHMGACSSTTETNAEYLYDNNFLYSKHLAEWALENSIKFIYASSAATYGSGNDGFDDNDQLTPSLKPLNMYAYSKLLFDKWVLSNKLESKLTGIRFFNVFGPNEYHKADMRSVAKKAFEQINDKGFVELFKSYHPDYADGEQVRDFIYIKDCTKVMAQMLELDTFKGIYNLGTGKARSWKDLVSAVFNAMGKNPDIRFIEMPQHLRDKYQYKTEATIAKLRSAGFRDEFTSLEDAVTDYVQNYLMKEDAYL